MNKWEMFSYLVLGIGLFEFGSKLTVFNDDLGLLVGGSGLLLFVYVTIKLYRFTKQNEPKEEMGVKK